jgi:hypothetical protein
MDSLLSFPVGLFHPYNMPVYPGALRIADNSEVIGLDSNEMASTNALGVERSCVQPYRG